MNEREQWFLDAVRAGQAAQSRGEFEASLVGVAPDVEWVVGGWVLDGDVLHGHDAVIKFFADVQEAGHWVTTAQEVEELGPNRMLVRQHGRMVGRTTGISDEMEFFQLFELGDSGVKRVLEFLTRDEALAAS